MDLFAQPETMNRESFEIAIAVTASIRDKERHKVNEVHELTLVK